MNNLAVWLGIICFMVYIPANSQTLNPTDSTVKEHHEILNTLKKVKMSGYFQAQYQMAEEEGISYYGGNFAPNQDSRFMIRRGRIKLSYTSKPFELVIVTDNTEKEISLHDFYGSYSIPKLNLKLTAGLDVRPFGFEQTYSSSKNEGPERARFNGVLVPSEADLGLKIGYYGIKHLTMEVACFNGTAAAADFDSYKDLSGRISFDNLSKSNKLTAGLSYYSGGIAQANNRLFEMGTVGSEKQYILQDTVSHGVGAKVDRQYFGADLQYSRNNPWGTTTLRGEWVSGKQPGTTSSSNSPKTSTAPIGDSYLRNFNAMSAMFIQEFGNTNLRAVVKYDWYDPNTDVEKDEIGVTSSGSNKTDLKYSTLGLGLNYQYKNITLIAFYEFITNETSANLSGFDKDIKDNVFTLRSQFKF